MVDSSDEDILDTVRYAIEQAYNSDQDSLAFINGFISSYAIDDLLYCCQNLFDLSNENYCHFSLFILESVLNERRDDAARDVSKVFAVLMGIFELFAGQDEFCEIVFVREKLSHLISRYICIFFSDPTVEDFCTHIIESLKLDSNIPLLELLILILSDLFRCRASRYIMHSNNKAGFADFLASLESDLASFLYDVVQGCGNDVVEESEYENTDATRMIVVSLRCYESLLKSSKLEHALTKEWITILLYLSINKLFVRYVHTTLLVVVSKKLSKRSLPNIQLLLEDIASMPEEWLSYYTKDEHQSPENINAYSDDYFKLVSLMEVYRLLFEKHYKAFKKDPEGGEVVFQTCLTQMINIAEVHPSPMFFKELLKLLKFVMAFKSPFVSVIEADIDSFCAIVPLLLRASLKYPVSVSRQFLSAHAGFTLQHGDHFLSQHVSDMRQMGKIVISKLTQMYPMVLEYIISETVDRIVAIADMDDVIYLSDEYQLLETCCSVTETVVTQLTNALAEPAMDNCCIAEDSPELRGDLASCVNDLLEWLLTNVQQFTALLPLTRCLDLFKSCCLIFRWSGVSIDVVSIDSIVETILHFSSLQTDVVTQDLIALRRKSLTVLSSLITSLRHTILPALPLLIKYDGALRPSEEVLLLECVLSLLPFSELDSSDVIFSYFKDIDEALTELSLDDLALNSNTTEESIATRSLLYFTVQKLLQLVRAVIRSTQEELKDAVKEYIVSISDVLSSIIDYVSRVFNNGEISPLLGIKYGFLVFSDVNIEVDKSFVKNFRTNDYLEQPIEFQDLDDNLDSFVEEVYCVDLVSAIWGFLGLSVHITSDLSLPELETVMSYNEFLLCQWLRSFVVPVIRVGTEEVLMGIGHPCLEGVLHFLQQQNLEAVNIESVEASFDDSEALTDTIKQALDYEIRAHVNSMLNEFFRTESYNVPMNHIAFRILFLLDDENSFKIMETFIAIIVELLKTPNALLLEKLSHWFTSFLIFLFYVSSDYHEIIGVTLFETLLVAISAEPIFALITICRQIFLLFLMNTHTANDNFFIEHLKLEHMKATIEFQLIKLLGLPKDTEELPIECFLDSVEVTNLPLEIIEENCEITERVLHNWIESFLESDENSNKSQFKDFLIDCKIIEAKEDQ
ncbi:hypothetical protein PCE1_003353 [Barthelona sp. PCE]